MTALLAAAVAGKGLVDPSQPVFHPDDEALLRGAAAFETVRIRGGRPVLLRRHVERLRGSCLALRLPPPDGVEELALAGHRRRPGRTRARCVSSGRG